MTSYPSAAAARVRLRREREENLVAKARQDTRWLTESLKCSGGRYGDGWPERHAGDPDGCSNDGFSCLCSCHDRKDAET